MEINEILEVFDRFDILNEEMEDIVDERSEEDLEDEEEEEIRQIFPNYDALSDRLRKTMYYGETLPNYDTPSLSLTEFSVEEFARGEFRRLDQLSISRAAWISQEACASPTSLLIALLYLERLRSSNPGYLAQTSSTDVFLVSLMVASKFLNDDGEEGEVFNEVWASSAGIDKSHINELEINFLSAIDWRIFVSENEFDDVLDNLEQIIARRHFEARGWATYTDLMVLSNKLEFLQLLNFLYQYAIKVTAVCISAYAASLITMVGACCVLNSTPLGPQAVRDSISTIISLGPFTTTQIKDKPTELNSSISYNYPSSIVLENDDEIIIKIVSNDYTWAPNIDFTKKNWTSNLVDVVDKSKYDHLSVFPNFPDKGRVCQLNFLTARINHCVGVR
ncbi:protein CNPPD1 [Lepeophtheirus salmonis]|nr:protein CNPPD1-like [Lepeophtheirus salmonis]